MNLFLNQIKFSKELNFLFLSILLFATATGIDFVTFPTVLNKHGVDAAHVGLAFTIDAFGAITMSFFLSRFVAHVTMMKALKIAAFSYAGIILVIYFYQNFYLWALLAFVMGAVWFIYVISRLSWLNILLSNTQRGVALGVFSMLISIGLALGPVIVSFTGAKNYLSFLISAALVIISFYCLKPLSRIAHPQIESRKIRLKEFLKNNPRCFFARFFLDFQTYLLSTLTVIFGVRIGLSYEAAGLLISSYVASGFFDMYVGFLLKKISPYKLINIGYLGCIYSFIAIMLYQKSYTFLVISYFIFGLFIACIYVSVYKISNDDYAKEKLIAANAAFQLIGSIGGLFGAFIGGCLMNILGAQGFTITMVLGGIFYITFLIFYEKKIYRH